MLKISAVYLIGKAEIPIHYTTWAPVEQALLHSVGNPQFYSCMDLAIKNTSECFGKQPTKWLEFGICF
jgi:hypothetical protein